MNAQVILVSSTEWQRQALDIRVGTSGSNNSLAPVKAWRYREMAVHKRYTKQGEGRTWRISHVPSGLSFGFDFRTREAAMAAAVDLDRLRNNWSDIDQDDVNNVKARAVEILKSHGGEIKLIGRNMKPRCNINGY